MTKFDGNDFTISNLNLNRPSSVSASNPVLSGQDANNIGLFATAGSDDLSIENLGLDGVTYLTSRNCNNIGALVGSFDGSGTSAKSLTIKNVMVSNVSLDAGSNTNNSNSVAALVGNFVGKNLKIEGTDVAGTSAVKGTSYLGGFVGNLGASNDVEFKSSSLAGLTITVQGTPTAAKSGTVAYLIGGVSGAVSKLTINTNCDVTPDELTDTQRVAWKYKGKSDNDGKFFWGAENGYVGFALNGAASYIGTYKIGSEVQVSGDAGKYNIYKGY
jgi:hypothetical protein